MTISLDFAGRTITDYDATQDLDEMYDHDTNANHYAEQQEERQHGELKASTARAGAFQNGASSPPTPPPHPPHTHTHTLSPTYTCTRTCTHAKSLTRITCTHHTHHMLTRARTHSVHRGRALGCLQQRTCVLRWRGPGVCNLTPSILFFVVGPRLFLCANPVGRDQPVAAKRPAHARVHRSSDVPRGEAAV